MVCKVHHKGPHMLALNYQSLQSSCSFRSISMPLHLHRIETVAMFVILIFSAWFPLKLSLSITRFPLLVSYRCLFSRELLFRISGLLLITAPMWVFRGLICLHKKVGIPQKVMFVKAPALNFFRRLSSACFPLGESPFRLHLSVLSGNKLVADQLAVCYGVSYASRSQYLIFLRLHSITLACF